MKNYTAIIFAFLVIGFLVWMYFDKESGHEQEIIKIRRELELEYADKIDSVREVYKPYVIEYGKEKLARIRSEENAKAWERKFRNEKNNHRPFTDHATDSLVAEVR